jgi:hypothetical protein
MATRVEVTVTYPHAAYLDLTIEQGDTFTLSGVRKVAGVATAFENDVAGKLRIRPTDPEYTTILHEADIDFSGNGGTFVVTISAADTATFTWAEAVYEMYFTETESQVAVTGRLVEGTVVIKRTQGADAP